MADHLLEALAKASAGLLYPSETDSPFEPFRWQAPGVELTADGVAKLAHKRGRVTEVTLKEFFGELNSGDDTERFTALEALIESNLKNTRIYRIGRTRVHVYVVGIDSASDWVGLHTTSVET